jgi:hypothetical protein
MQDQNWADPAATEELLDYAGLLNRLPVGELAAQRMVRAAESQNADGRSDWDYSPCVVARAYNNFAGAQVVGDGAYSDLHAAGSQIADTVFIRRQPVIALIDAAGTYVVIVGVTLGPEGTKGPPASLFIDDPWNIAKDGATRNGGTWRALGSDRDMTWDVFASHFTPVPDSLSGPWSDKWIIMAAGLPVLC